jgi:hypothetical protein
MAEVKCGAGPLCVRSKTMGEVGKVRNLKLLSRSARALLLEGICRELGEGKKESRKRVAKIGFEESMKRGEHERALRFAKVLNQKEETWEPIVEAWMRELVDCGMKQEACDVSKKYDIAIAAYQRMSTAFDSAMAKKYGEGERANALMELEEAIKWEGGIWGDGAKKGAMKRHGLSEADGKIVLLNLLEEFDAHVLERAGGILGKPVKICDDAMFGEYRNIEDVLSDSETGLGNLLFGRYKEGYNATYSEHRMRLLRDILGDRFEAVWNVCIMNSNIMMFATKEVAGALLEEMRLEEARALVGRNEFSQGTFDTEKFARARDLLVKNPDWIVGEKFGGWFDEEVGADVARVAALQEECKKPLLIAKNHGIVERVKGKAVERMSTKVAEFALRACSGMGAEEQLVQWRAIMGRVPRYGLGDKERERVAMRAIKKIEEWGPESIKERAKIKAAEMLHYKEMVEFLEGAGELLGQ